MFPVSKLLGRVNKGTCELYNYFISHTIHISAAKSNIWQLMMPSVQTHLGVTNFLFREATFNGSIPVILRPIPWQFKMANTDVKNVALTMVFVNYLMGMDRKCVLYCARLLLQFLKKKTYL